jgi:hypothetical protein
MIRRRGIVALLVVVLIAGCVFAAPEASHAATNTTVAPTVGI